MNESGTGYVDSFRKLASGRKVAGRIRSPVDARGLQLECARVLYDGLLIPVLLYFSETMILR